ncbi:hypothetical protein Tco_0169361 [Tanacetum coccineum]
MKRRRPIRMTQRAHLIKSEIKFVRKAVPTTTNAQVIPTLVIHEEVYGDTADITQCLDLKQIRLIDEVFGIWKSIGGNTRDLGSFREEMDETTDLHQHCSRISRQKPETASQITRDAVPNPTTMASQDIATTSAHTIHPII